MKKANKPNKPQGRIVAIIFLAGLALLAVVNAGLLKEPLIKLWSHETDFVGFTEQVKENYTSNDFVTKNQFVNVNGLFARITGRRTLNSVVRGENGMLTQAKQKLDMTPLAEGIQGFSNYLEGEEIPFLYIQAPCKENCDTFLPEGVTSYADTNVSELLNLLMEGEVNTLDLRPQITQSMEQVEKFFYRTDHHWNSDGAFAAFQVILPKLAEMFPNANIDLGYASEDLWERHEKENWFLGSHGKRVGQYFGGTDSLIWHTPRFETEMSCIVPKYHQIFSGDFEDANIREEYIQEKDYFGKNAYCVYIGGDYPLVQHRNPDAPSKLKVLWIKDSFTLPVQSFLSTVVQEIDVIDPRHWTESTWAEYVAWTQPDVVIMMVNPSEFGNEAYSQWGETVQNVQEYVEVERCDIELEAKENRYNYAALEVEANSVYQVSFNEVEALAGDPQGASLVLYDATEKKILANATFDVKYSNKDRDYVWTFKTQETENSLQLLFYSGLRGATAGNSVIYRNVRLDKAQ